MEKEISQAVIRRMPRYYRYLGELLEEGVERISTNDLSHRMMVTASQIRQDLNNFGGFGQQGYGYNVKYLYDEIGKILGLNETHNIIMIGAGNLGQAITNYVKFERFGFIITALFDVKPSLKFQMARIPRFTRCCAVSSAFSFGSVKAAISTLFFLQLSYNIVKNSK